jgi:transposase
MAMGKRKPCQQSFVITTDHLLSVPGHPFYRQLNTLLDEARFDHWAETRCVNYYSTDIASGQPSLPPGVYFRMLLIGYFENLDSQRGIAWRCADSLSLRSFLGLPLHEATPDHSSMTRTRQRLPVEVFDELFEFVLSIAAAKDLIAGTTIGVDSTTLEANAAMKSIVRKDTGETWKEYVIRLMREAEAIAPDEHPTAAEIIRFDKARKDKTVSNEEWQCPHDPDATITKMKDGTTHLAYKAEHVVDLESEIVVAAEVYTGIAADTATVADSVLAARTHLTAAGVDTPIVEAVMDKGYHAVATLDLCDDMELRTYVPEPQRPHPIVMGDLSESEQRALRNARRRMERAKGKQLQRRRSEVVERSFAQVCDTGGSRRSHLRGLEEVRKRYTLAAAAHNLGRILRATVGVGKPKVLQNGGAAAKEMADGVGEAGQSPQSILPRVWRWVFGWSRGMRAIRG